MKVTTEKFQELLDEGFKYVRDCPESQMSQKAVPEKWSKKEILGHLIDSAINNLQRFTEIQFESKPYKIRKYKQVELVIANNYQASDTKEILAFWLSINTRILIIIKQQTAKTLNFPIELEKSKFDLRFLMTDYVAHLEHHLKQIMC